MPTFVITGPDGAKYRVTAPEGATDQEVLARVQEQASAPVAPAAQPAAPAAGGGITDYLPRAITDIPGEIYDVGKAALTKIGDNLNPFSDARRASIERQSKMGFVEGFGEQLKRTAGVGSGIAAIPELAASPITGAARSLIGNPMATVERTIGEMVKPSGAPVTPNDDGWLATIRSRIVGQASPDRTDEQATADWKQAADIAMMGAAPRSAGPVGLRAAPTKAPAAQELLSTASNQFDAVRNSGAALPATDVQIIAQGIRNKITQSGADPGGQKVVFDALDRLEAKGLGGGPVPYGEIDTIRKQINSLKLSPDGGVRKYAKEATGELMDLLTATLPQNVSGTLKQAIANHAAGKRSNTVMGKAALADLNAATAGAGGNIDNASRQAIKQLVRPIHNDIVPQAKRMGFSDAEIAQMQAVARGSAGGNFARFVGKAAPTGAVSAGIGGGAGFALGGPVGAVALPAIGAAAKFVGDRSTRKALEALDELVRSRSPLAKNAPQQMMPVPVGLLGSIPSAQIPVGAGGLLGMVEPTRPRKGDRVKRRAQ